MKIGLFEIMLYVFSFCPLFLVQEGGRTKALCSEYKLTKFILQVLCRFYHLASYKKSSLTHKASAQIP